MELNTVEKPSEAPISAGTNDSALEEISFATGETELGAALIARSRVGVCSIIMGSAGDELSNDLAERFPESKLVRDNAKLADDLHQVQRFIETPASALMWRSTWVEPRSSATCGLCYWACRQAPPLPTPRSDGTLSGYRWGVERKRALPAREDANERP